MNINRRFYQFTKHKSYTSPYIPAQARTSNSVNMTSEQTSTQTTCANCCHVPTNANHFLHKMKLVYIAMVLLLQLLSYVVHLGDGSVYRCDSPMPTAQVIDQTHSVLMRKGCTLSDISIQFDLYWMRFSFYHAKQKNPRAYGNKDGVNINISEAVFHNSPIILQNGNNLPVQKYNEDDYIVPLQFTMSKCNLSGTSGLILCPDTDDICMLPRHSRIRIIHSNFNISIQRDVFDDDFRGVFTFGALSLAYSTIEIVDNDITGYKEDNGKVMAVFYLLKGTKVYDKGHFNIQSNKIYMGGGRDMKEMYLWYTNRRNSNLTISGKGSRMVWRRNCVAANQLKMSSAHVFHGFWNIIDKGILLFDENNFTTMTIPGHAKILAQFLWGKAGDNTMTINTNGEMSLTNTRVLSNGHFTVMWYNDESTYKTNYNNPPLMSWKLSPYFIPTLDNSNLRQYMCAV